jgi:hypothetical protein
MGGSEIKIAMNWYGSGEGSEIKKSVLRITTISKGFSLFVYTTLGCKYTVYLPPSNLSAVKSI